MTTFQSLGLGEEFLQAIQDLGFETPSEVQQKAIPFLLQNDADIVSLAQTGTGKLLRLVFQCSKKYALKAEKHKDSSSLQRESYVSK